MEKIDMNEIPEIRRINYLAKKAYQAFWDLSLWPLKYFLTHPFFASSNWTKEVKTIPCCKNNPSHYQTCTSSQLRILDHKWPNNKFPLHMVFWRTNLVKLKAWYLIMLGLSFILHICPSPKRDDFLAIGDRRQQPLKTAHKILFWLMSIKGLDHIIWNVHKDNKWRHSKESSRSR